MTKTERTIESISDDLWSMSFSIQRSIRYHDRRTRFYQRTDSLINFVSLIFGSAAVITIGSNLDTTIPSLFAAGTAVLSSLNLVYKFAQKSSLHSKLRDEFIALSTKVDSREHSEKHLNKLNRQRANIEMKEPSKLYALDVLCHNETVYSLFKRDEVRDHIHPLNWFQKLTSNLFPWGNIVSK